MKIKTLIAVLFMTSLLVGCKKEKIKGCKVSYATNYKSNAEEDDGSCTYASKLIFWQNQTNASSWSSLGVTSLKFYVEGQLIGSTAANLYYSSAPSCSGNGLTSVTKSLGISNSKTFTYSITDQNGLEWYNGSVTLEGSNCTVKQFN